MTFVEFETWKNETCICGYMALDEADDEAPLCFYDRNGFESGSDIRTTKPILSPKNKVEEAIVADWEEIIRWFEETDVVQYLVDFADGKYYAPFKNGIELYINSSKLDGVKEIVEDKTTTIRVKQSTKDKLSKLGHKGMSFDDIINELLERYGEIE